MRFGRAIVLLAAAVAGCATVSGLDGLVVGDPDASCNACADASAEAAKPTDSGAANDADAGAGPSPDVVTVDASAPPGVTCGTTVCTAAAPICCLEATSATCVKWASQCTSGVTLACDSAEDCDAGRCCGISEPGSKCDVVTGASCAPTCYGEAELCAPGGRACEQPNSTCTKSACSLPGYDICQ